MTKKHKQILAKFKDIWNTDIRQVWPKGKDAIRIRLKNSTMSDLVFTWLSDNDWKLETVQMFKHSVDGI